MKLPDLFGKASSGKIKLWRGEVVDNGDGTFSIFVDHGMKGGKLQCDEKIITEGKNIGRSNETTPYEQAVSELKSAWTKKKDELYVEDMADIVDNTSGFFLPMLAHKFTEQSAKIDFKAAVLQFKYDGFCALAKKENGVVYLWSRQGKLLEVPTEIKAELTLTLKEGETTHGELYNYGWGFQRLASAIKKRNVDTPKLQYYIYDTPILGKTYKERFIDRWSIVPSILSPDLTLVPGTTRLVLAPTQIVTDPETIPEIMAMSLGLGYEGLMIRNLNSYYTFKSRSTSLLKIKEFLDAEFEIIGGKEGTGRESGTVVFKCVTDAGVEFDVRPRGTVEERSIMFDNLDSYIGKKLTVRYQNMSDEGSLRFPVGLHVRPDFDMPTK